MCDYFLSQTHWHHDRWLIAGSYSSVSFLQATHSMSILTKVRQIMETSTGGAIIGISTSKSPLDFFNGASRFFQGSPVLCISATHQNLKPMHGSSRPLGFKEATLRHALAILATHHHNIPAVIVRDPDFATRAMSLLIDLLAHLVKGPTGIKTLLFMSPTLPISHLRERFENINILYEEGHRNRLVEYLISCNDPTPRWTFLNHVDWFLGWFEDRNQSCRRVLCLVGSVEKAQLLRTQFQDRGFENWKTMIHASLTTEPLCPGFFPPLGDKKILMISTPNDPDWGKGADVLIDFTAYCFSKNGGSRESKLLFARRERLVKEFGIVLRLTTSLSFGEMPETPSYDYPPEWGMIYLASLGLDPRAVVPNSQNTPDWCELVLERSARKPKRCKRFLSHPFSVRCNLMLDRLRGFPADVKVKSWIVLSIVLINWFDQWPDLIQKVAGPDMQRLYGDTKDLMTHLRIASMVISGFLLLDREVVFKDEHCVRLMDHYRRGLAAIHHRRSDPPHLQLVDLNQEVMDTIAYFLMTDTRVEMPIDPDYNVPLITVPLCFRAVDNHREMILWVYLPSAAIAHWNSLSVLLQTALQERMNKQKAREHFYQRVVLYFQNVLSLVCDESGNRSKN